jgi:hypothetical protein
MCRKCDDLWARNKAAPQLNTLQEIFGPMLKKTMWWAGGVAGVAGVAAAAWLATRRSVNSAVAPSLPRRKLVLLTDLEPDDLLAMRVLQERHIVPTAIVVGEGDRVEAQVARAKVYLTQLGWTDTRIMMGLPSTKTYPAVTDIGLGHACAPDDSAVLTFDTAAPAASLLALLRAGPESEFVYEDHGDCTGHHHQPTTLLCLKPPREIMAALQEDPTVFRSVRLCIYGSFNLREVGLPAVLPWLNPDTTPFSQVLWFENFQGMAGGTRNLNPDTMAVSVAGESPVAQDDFAHSVAAYTRAWDAFILQDCHDTMADIERRNPHWKSDPKDAAAHARNLSCATDVSRFEGRQMVAADPVLALVLDNPDFEPYGRAVSSVTLPNGQSYPVVDVKDGPAPSTTTKVIKFTGLPDAKVLDGLSRAWRSVFPFA